MHRLVRISPFDAPSRRHTAFAGVEVAPLVEDDVDIEIEPDDLQIDTYRASGAGGQHVNKTDSAVRITHRPTGIVVQCQNERSQSANKETAMAMLRAKLLELEEERRRAEIAKEKGEAQDVGWGSQIRSYVLHPYTMVKDHRTDVEVGNAQGVLDGDLDEFVRAELLRRAGPGRPRACESLSLLALLGALALLVPLTSSAVDRDPQKQTFVVLYERGASAQDASAAVESAGGAWRNSGRPPQRAGVPRVAGAREPLTGGTATTGDPFAPGRCHVSARAAGQGAPSRRRPSRGRPLRLSGTCNDQRTPSSASAGRRRRPVASRHGGRRDARRHRAQLQPGAEPQLHHRRPARRWTV